MSPNFRFRLFEQCRQGYPVRSALSSLFRRDILALSFWRNWIFGFFALIGNNDEYPSIHVKSQRISTLSWSDYRYDPSPDTLHIWTTKGRHKDRYHSQRYHPRKTPSSTKPSSFIEISPTATYNVQTLAKRVKLCSLLVTQWFSLIIEVTLASSNSSKCFGLRQIFRLT